MRVRLPNNWEPRSYQLPLWLALEQGKRFADVCWHRRAGKDDVCLHRAAVAAFERVGGYWHMLPEASQARKAIWDAINPHTGKRRIDEAFPKALRETTLNNEMFIRFKNGSTWQVVGSDNFDSLVGSPPIGIVFSEWSLAKPDAWTYLRPILQENGGWALFIWTPRGRNHATRAFESRELDDKWFTQRLSARTTGVFTEAQLAYERKAYIDECGSEEEGDSRFRQEYLVDFEAAVPGSYYGPLLAKAKDEGRIGSYPYNPAYKVDSAWDLGRDDYTAVWLLQNDGVKVWAIGYHEANGLDAEPEYIVPAAMPKAYGYGLHYFPHDLKQTHWGAGARSRIELVRAAGLLNLRIGIPNDPEDRVAATRKLLPLMAFDADGPGINTGLDRLRSYRRKYNDALNVYGGPLHDEASHGSDALGEYAINSPLIKKRDPVKSPNPPDMDRWRGRTQQPSAWVA